MLPTLEGATELGEFGNPHFEVHSGVDQAVKITPYCAILLSGTWQGFVFALAVNEGSWSRQPGLGWRSKKALRSSLPFLLLRVPGAAPI